MKTRRCVANAVFAFVLATALSACHECVFDQECNQKKGEVCLDRLCINPNPPAGKDAGADAGTNTDADKDAIK